MASTTVSPPGTTAPSTPSADGAYSLAVHDQAPVTLTRVRGGSKGPVLLVHGVSVSSRIFALPTVRENFVQYLVANDYDVWLLDWRGSLVHPLREFTLDDAASQDLPAAVSKVRQVTGAKSVQVVAHCAGSVIVFMAISKGLLPNVRSVLASQVGLHTVVPAASALKARLGLVSTLGRLGMKEMSPADDDGHPLFQSAFGRFSDAVHHECTSTFCHRLTFIYGHLYHHANLNQATHDTLEHEFGGCNILALRHFSQLAVAGHSRAFDYGRRGNEERYGESRPPDFLDPTHFALPITFLSGALNKTWLPVSTKRTYDWLVDAHGPDAYARHVIDGYGHLDTFMGVNANVDTYPLMLEHLERH